MDVEIIIKPRSMSKKQFHDKFFKDVEEGMRKLIKNGGTDESDKIYLADTKSLQNCLSEKRIELLSTIKHKKPKSIYELAKLTKRKFEPVKKDIKILKAQKLVSLKQKRDGRKNKIPVCNVNKITISI